MSVILDALKRVQDENHRRGNVAGATNDYETVRDSEEMVEQLSHYEPEEPAYVAEPRRLSPLTWIGIIALCSMAVIATALWWFQPNFTGSQANAGRPLLTDLREAQTGTAVAQPAATNGPSTSNPSEAMSDGDAARAAAPTTSAAATSAREEDDLSDLSSALPPANVDNQPAVRDEAPSFDLRSYESEPQVREAASSTSSRATEGTSNSGFTLTSSDNAPTQSREVTQAPVRAAAPANDNPFAAREPEAVAEPANRTLVDPTVRSGFQRGLQLQKAGDLGGAEDAYLRALKLDPDNARINANLAVLYEGQGRFQLAERHLRRALNVDPQNASAHNNLGVVLYRMGNLDGALIEFNRALALDAKQLDAYTNKGLIFMRWGRYEDARRAFSQVIVADPENALAHYNLGLVYEELQMWDQAIDSYYRFLDTGSSQHPDIMQYVSQRLPWVESRLGDGGR
ncbi:MAG: tetratricopeptide repeat protein [Acidobacteria bacterium]|nr:tetratricopeptide repeat protein [Acidobacteriota bacterium]